MSGIDRSYYLRRAEEESELAAQATHPGVAAAHSQFAEEYRRRIEPVDEADGTAPGSAAAPAS